MKHDYPDFIRPWQIVDDSQIDDRDAAVTLANFWRLDLISQYVAAFPCSYRKLKQFRNEVRWIYGRLIGIGCRTEADRDAYIDGFLKVSRPMREQYPIRLLS